MPKPTVFENGDRPCLYLFDDRWDSVQPDPGVFYVLVRTI